MMGYAAGVYASGFYKSGNDDLIGNKSRTELRTWLTDVNCTGNETSIQECRNVTWGISSCNKSEDVAIKCYSK